jgi:hypothetical protein
MRSAQQERPTSTDSGKTTHFGFETVAEAMKQSKGMRREYFLQT